jgi:hypothetical protein
LKQQPSKGLKVTAVAQLLKLSFNPGAAHAGYVKVKGKVKLPL